MDIGMLWFDDNPRMAISEKVARAAAYYASKYGCKPTLCYVHPGVFSNEMNQTVGGVEIKTNRSIRKNHFWLGVQ